MRSFTVIALFAFAVQIHVKGSPVLWLVHHSDLDNTTLRHLWGCAPAAVGASWASLPLRRSLASPLTHKGLEGLSKGFRSIQRPRMLLSRSPRCVPIAHAVMAPNSSGSLSIPRLELDKVAFFCCDMQEVFHPKINQADCSLAASKALLKACNLWKAPLLITEQYPEKLGQTCQELRTEIKWRMASTKATDAPVVLHAKTDFSMVSDGVLQNLGIGLDHSVVVFGWETHVCVQQTCFDLLERGFKVWLARDAVGSQRLEDRLTALDLLRQQGVVISSAEAILFEIMRGKEHPRFKEISKICQEMGSELLALRTREPVGKWMAPPASGTRFSSPDGYPAVSRTGQRPPAPSPARASAAPGFNPVSSSNLPAIPNSFLAPGPGRPELPGMPQGEQQATPEYPPRTSPRSRQEDGEWPPGHPRWSPTRSPPLRSDLPDLPSSFVPPDDGGFSMFLGQTLARFQAISILTVALMGLFASTGVIFAMLRCHHSISAPGTHPFLAV